MVVKPYYDLATSPGLARKNQLPNPNPNPNSNFVPRHGFIHCGLSVLLNGGRLIHTAGDSSEYQSASYMGKPKSEGQRRLNRMRFMCKLTMEGKLNIEDLVDKSRDLSASDLHLIF